MKRLFPEQINELPRKYDNNVNADIDEIMRDGEYIGQYKIGNPYKIEDTTYYPQEYDDYEEVGVSSWYGDDFQFDGLCHVERYQQLDRLKLAFRLFS